MKTNILDELELDDEAKDALSREAVRRQCSMSELVKEALLKTARAIKASRQKPSGPHRQAA